jgi:hypothetical protein
MINRWQGGAKVQDIIDDVRTQISDVGELYTDTFLRNAISSCIKLIALREDGRPFFKFKLQTELATLNADGTRAARWDLPIPGKYSGKEYFNLIKMDECYTCLKPCYKTPDKFFKCCRFPEKECPGDPCNYTLEHFGNITTLVLDRPLADLVAIEAVIYIVPDRITAEDETIALADGYSEILCELVKIFINKEQTSFDEARSRYEDFDAAIEDAIQNMALVEMNDELIIVKGALS